MIDYAQNRFYVGGNAFQLQVSTTKQECKTSKGKYHYISYKCVKQIVSDVPFFRHYYVLWHSVRYTVFNHAMNPIIGHVSCCMSSSIVIQLIMSHFMATELKLHKNKTMTVLTDLR